jgi:hypothetical protein
MFDSMLLGILLCAFGPPSPRALECFGTIKKLDGAPSERETAQRALMTNPAAIWAVLWGAEHGNADISGRCASILEAWSAQARLAGIVKGAQGDFDRFLNELLHSPAKNLKVFAQASDVARACDGYLANYLPSLTAYGPDPLTPFHDFRVYIKQRDPVVFIGDSWQPGRREEPKLYIAKCFNARVDDLSSSMLLSESNVEVGHCSHSLIVSGGDVNIGGMHASLVIAAGDVSLKGGPFGHVFVIAGGKVLIGGGTVGALFISPAATGLTTNGNLTRPVIMMDGKSKPAPGLFRFVELGKDYGIEARIREGRLRVATIDRTSGLAEFLKEGDVVVAIAKKKVESVAQFRRLLGYSHATGQLELHVERSGKSMNIHRRLKSR